MKYVLVIAGSDSSGGAGIQADIRTVASLGGHPLTAIAALTAQNSLGIAAIHKVPAAFLETQINSILEDLSPDAVKLGMLYSAANVGKVAELLERHRLPNVVMDPVLKATTGRPLIEADAVALLRKLLMPMVTVVTPNLEEAALLSGMRVESTSEMEEAARVIGKIAPGVIVTGGHLKSECVDVLFDGKETIHFRSERIESDHTHGSGCVFSTALATYLAITGDLRTAAGLAHEFAHAAIHRGYSCGRGAGPVGP
jgi:hydroxymethylpyrimidine kinase/phosphomethylpyrimidine kinase